jgi:precorrin-3B C17-methyltransferase
MSGKLFVIGTGPGNPEQTTPQALAAIAGATDFFGYKPYLDRLSLQSHQTPHASDNREELDRARAALDLACSGKTVAVVSGGDPGVFAMAAAICEAVEFGKPEWRALDIEIVPGITAMLAVAARLGAPLGHDFCAISLSDNLKPWDVIEARLKAVTTAGFVVALYNPISKARPWQLGRALEIVAEILPPTTPILFGRAAGRPDERMNVVPLSNARADMADMATCVMIGSAETRIVTRDGREPLIYSPRSIGKPAR